MPSDVFMIGSSYRVPGILQGVEVPDRALVWQVSQGSLGGIGASTTWRGVKLDEGGIVVTTIITDASGAIEKDCDEAARIWGAWLDLIHPESGTKKPPAWDISHPLLAAQRPQIRRAAHSKNKMVQLAEGKRAWVGSIVLIEYKPLRLATPAAPDPAALDNTTPTPQDKNELAIQQLMNEINGVPHSAARTSDQR